MKLTIHIGILIGILVLIGTESSIATDKARQEYDQMVEEAVRESDAYLEEKQQEQQEALEEAQEQDEAALQERVQAESDRIQAEMDAIRGRALSSTYTQGMKDNQLQQLQEKLDLLMSDPEAYFGGQ